MNRLISYFNKLIYGSMLVVGIAGITFISIRIQTNYSEKIKTVEYRQLTLQKIINELTFLHDKMAQSVHEYAHTGDVIHKSNHTLFRNIGSGILIPNKNTYTELFTDSYLGLYTNMLPITNSIPREIQLLGLDDREQLKFDEFLKKTNSISDIQLTYMENKMPPHHHEHLSNYNIINNLALSSLAELQSIYLHRTNEQLKTLRNYESIAKTTSIISIIILIISCAWLSIIIYKIIGGTSKTVISNLKSINDGQFAELREITLTDKTNMLTRWVSEISYRLNLLYRNKTMAEQTLARITHVYKAVAQCEYVASKSSDERELFDNICNTLVDAGDISLAWMGVYDSETHHIIPSSIAGKFREYAESLIISTNTNDITHRGPTATSFTTNSPVWVQDFMNNDSTAYWKLNAYKSGIMSSGSIPILKRGRPYAVLCVYSTKTEFFDMDTQNLVLDIVTIINDTLVSFDKNEHQKISEHEVLMLTQAIEQSSNAIVITDKHREITYVNQAFTKNLGYTKEEVLGKDPKIIKSGKTPPETYVDMYRSLLAGKPWNGEFINRHKNGSEYHYAVSVSPVLNSDGIITNYISIEDDITDKKMIADRIHYLANFDKLTDLLNRTGFEDKIKPIISNAEQNESTFAVMFLDIDHFKDINDTLGHTVGDQLLIQLASRFKTIIRDTDIVSRLGGDEFVFLLNNTDSTGATIIADKIIKEIRKPVNVGLKELTVSASIGIAVYPTDGDTIETLARNADSAMYKSKQNGRNSYSFYTKELHIKLERYTALSEALRQAIEKDEISVHYQPQMDISGKLTGAEALMRWNSPTLGNVSPGEFIPIAEETGIILLLGEWIIRHVAKQAKIWLDNGLHLIYAVNISPVQFKNCDLPKLVQTVLTDTELPAEYIELELTESMAVNDPEAAIDIMDRLHRLGIRMSIDDFGTGYSSLNHLKKFKVYKLKIDQTFVRDISVDNDDRAIVDAIIRMAKGLNIKTIAEGVETIEQLEFLKEKGCDEIQGYYYSKPLPADEFEKFVKEHLSDI